MNALALASTEQLKLFPEQMFGADDLALEFGCWARIVLETYEGEIPPAFREALVGLDRKLSAMSRERDLFGPDLCTGTALESNPHWHEVRVLAARVLELFERSDS